MRIAIITSAAQGVGGVETFNSYLRRALEESGHLVDVIGHERLPSNWLVRKAVARLGLPFVLGNYFSLLSLFHHYDVAVCNGEFSYQVRHPAALVVFHGGYYGYAKALKPFISEAAYLTSMWLAEVQRRGAAGKTVVAVSQFVADVLGEQGIRADVVIPNCVDTQFFAPDPELQASEEYLFVGRYDYAGKGFDVLERLGELGLIIHCVTDQQPQHENLLWTPFLPPDRLPAFYNRAACLLFPSRFEGLQLVPLEAMACGCPVVISDVGLGPELKKHIPEFVISGEPSEHVEQYYERARQIAANRSHWSALARQYVGTFHNYPLFRQRWNALVDQVRSGNHPEKRQP